MASRFTGKLFGIFGQKMAAKSMKMSGLKETCNELFGLAAD
jgi:hypothetical protein